MWRFLRPAAFLVLGVAALGLVVLNVLAWTGRLVDEAPPPPEAQEALPQQAPPPPEPAAARPAPSTPRNSTVVLTAVRGACWLSVRLGAESGEVLYEGVLAQGDSLRFKRRKLWLRLGAASNLEISVDGKRADVPVGTVDLILPVT